MVDYNDIPLDVYICLVIKTKKNMKTLLTGLAISLSICVSAQFTKDEIKALKTSVKDAGAAGGYDVHNRNFKVYSDMIRLKDSNFYLYFTLSKSGDSIVKSPIYMKLEYNASSWLFMEEISVAMAFVQDGDENISTAASMALGDGSRNVNSGGTITEITVESLSDEMYTLLKYLSKNSRMCSVKISGKDAYQDYGVFGAQFTKNLPGLFKAYEEIDFNT